MEEAIENLPEGLRALIEEIPVIVLDCPTDEMLKSMGIGPEEFEEARAEFCGLHTGTAITERSLTYTDLPSDIHLFRTGIVELAGGWKQPEADDIVYEEIMVTLLHEIGHHFGLDEDDLEELGYG